MRIRVVAWATGGVLGLAAPLIPAVPGTPALASAARALPCHASMSNPHPADYTTTDVRVRTASRASVTSIAHYRTVNRRHHRQASAAGRVSIPYYISGATPGYTVVVSVRVRRGARTGSCSTSFTPHR
jgi:hypothetical protein